MSEKDVTYAGQKTRIARLKATVGNQKELAEKAGLRRVSSVT